MRRFALERLKEWKEKKNRKPLIIRGARQVGKTWLMKEFGASCFEKTAYVNFDSNPRMQQVFDGEINVERILLAISVETGVSVKSEDTLLIFDEIQEVPKALSSLKYFCENAPEYAIVAGCGDAQGHLFPGRQGRLHGSVSAQFPGIFVRLGRRTICRASAVRGYANDQYLRFQIQGSSERVLLCRWYAGSGPVLCE
mgnify:CR=1 FL=1